MTAPTAVSLFAGVGGIDLGLERAGFRVTTAVEIDKAARGVLAEHFPNTTLRTDVTEVTADDLRADGFVPTRGLVAAGFPCQDLSVAGRRRGMGEGTRSGLYWHVARLVADLRPTWVLLENVPGLLSAVCPCTGDGACGRGFDCPGELHTVKGGACGPGECMREHGGAMGAVIGSLVELGYGIAYRVLDAQFFGVPQRRRRVVIVGHLADVGRPVSVLLEPEGGSGDPAAGEPAGSEVAATLTAGAHRGGVSAPGRRAEDDVNLVVAPTLTAPGSEGGRRDKIPVVVGSLLANGGDGPVNDAQAGRLVVGPVTGGGRRGYRVNAESAADGHLITYQKVTRPQTSDHPDVWEHREQAATLSPFDLGSESRAVELVVSATGDKTHALTAEGHDASEDGTGRGTPIVTHGVDTYNAALDGDQAHTLPANAGPGRMPHVLGFHMTQDPISGDVSPAIGRESTAGVMTESHVRRLTPLECERLQGFPDGWTEISDGKPQKDSPRYQQMGNAVAVPVFEWVARRIIREAAR